MSSIPPCPYYPVLLHSSIQSIHPILTFRLILFSQSHPMSIVSQLSHPYYAIYRFTPPIHQTRPTHPSIPLIHPIEPFHPSIWSYPFIESTLNQAGNIRMHAWNEEKSWSHHNRSIWIFDVAAREADARITVVKMAIPIWWAHTSWKFESGSKFWSGLQIINGGLSAW